MPLRWNPRKKIELTYFYMQSSHTDLNVMACLEYAVKELKVKIYWQIIVHKLAIRTGINWFDVSENISSLIR